MALTLASFKVLQEIGRDEVSVSYQALEPKAQTTIQLRAFSTALSTDIEFRDRLRTVVGEVRFIRQQNLGAVYSLVEEAEAIGIVSEYFEANPLSSYIGTSMGAIPLYRALPVFLQITEAVSYAHTRSIAHGYLNPFTIYLASDNSIKVTGLGIDRFLRSWGITPKTAVNASAYVSPEQLLGKEIDLRADVYSMCVILYEMVTGVLPYTITSNMREDDYKNLIIDSEIPDPRMVNPNIPAWLSKIILTGLSKNREERQSDSSTLMRQIKRGMDREEIQAYSIPGKDNVFDGKEYSDYNRDNLTREQMERQQGKQQQAPQRQQAPPRRQTPQRQQAPSRQTPQYASGPPVKLKKKSGCTFVFFIYLAIGAFIFIMNLTEDGGCNETTTQEQTSTQNVEAGMVVVLSGIITYAPSTGSETDLVELGEKTAVIDFLAAGITEVTVDEYQKFCKSQGKEMPAPPRGGWVGVNPIVNVSWYDCIEYCNWLSIRNGFSPFYDITPAPAETQDPTQPLPSAEESVRFTVQENSTADGYRLPTEAEWVYVAQSGNLHEQYIYSGGDDLGKVGWYLDDSPGSVLPVGTKEPNRLNIYDLSGSVREWCYDRYDKGARSGGGDASLQSKRIIHGGSWKLPELFARINYRDGADPKTISDDLGFRVVRTYSY